ncbi:MAG: hypothetical protein QXH91_04325 [Candidatus Bathyarchaeia archaeon]
MKKNTRRLISTIIQLKIAQAILLLTEKRKQYDRYMYKSEVAHLANITFNTLDQYLKKLENMHAIEYVPHIEHEWRGTFRLTKNGLEKMKTEIQELLRQPEEPGSNPSKSQYHLP